jgi:AcrR family transcriptional regulator
MIDTTVPTRSQTRQPGRPREFDIDAALDKAIAVFSELGYQGASIAELKNAMQLASGSLYKAFRNKRDIFLAAFDRYKLLRDAALRESIGTDGSGRDRLGRYLMHYAEGSHGSNGRKGCLVIGSAVELALFDDEAARRIEAAMTRNEAMIASLIREGRADGSINKGLDAASAARMMLCLTQGLKVVGRTGCERELALGAVAVAMKALD